MKKRFAKQVLIRALIPSTMLMLLVLLISLLAMRSLSASNDRFVDYIRGTAERENLIFEIQAAVDRRAIGMHDIALVNTPFERETIKAVAANANDKLHAALNKLRNVMDRDPDISERERSLLARIEMIETQYETAARATVELLASGKADVTCDNINNACRPMQAELMAVIREFVKVSRENSKIYVNTSAANYSSQQTLLLALSGFSFLMTAVLSLCMSRRIRKALNAKPAKLSVAAQHIAQSGLR